MSMKQEFPREYARIVESLLQELGDLAQGSSKSGGLNPFFDWTALTSMTDADAVLLKLYHVFGPMLASALQMVDKGSGESECGKELLLLQCHLTR